MNKDAFFKSLGDNKFLEGRKDQIKEWSEAFQVRSIGHMEGQRFYIAWKGTTRQVEGSEEFLSWGDAKAELAANWKRYLDEEFEREVLSPVDAEVRGSSEG